MTKVIIWRDRLLDMAVDYRSKGDREAAALLKRADKALARGQKDAALAAQLMALNERDWKDDIPVGTYVRSAAADLTP